MKEVKFIDVAQYYLGVKCQTTEGVGVFNAYYIETKVSIVTYGEMGPDYDMPHQLESEVVKPILRRIESLTEVEATHLFSIVDERVNFDCVVTDVFNYKVLVSKDIRGNDLDTCLNVGADFSLMFYTDESGEPVPIARRIKYHLVYDYLLKQGFDLFGLINSSQALDAGKIGEDGK